MPDVTYEIVQHDGGWAYKVDGVFSETFQTHAEALAAAQAAAEEQEVPGYTETIEYEDDKGKWHTEPPAAETARTPSSRTRIEPSRPTPGVWCRLLGGFTPFEVVPEGYLWPIGTPDPSTGTGGRSIEHVD
jgi:hypothetical protein